MNVAELIKQLQEYIDQYGAANVDIERSTNPWENYDTYSIIVEREETDEEYEQRLSLEKASQEIRERREKQEFERLQAKYGAKQ